MHSAEGTKCSEMQHSSLMRVSCALLENDGWFSSPDRSVFNSVSPGKNETVFWSEVSGLEKIDQKGDTLETDKHDLVV